MADRVRARASQRPPDSRALALVDVLARELHNEGDREDYHHPDNIHLHRVIERKVGLPLTLTALYLSVARRAGISAAGVALPGHVILRVRDGNVSHLVDPYSRGQLLTRRECRQYLAQHGIRADPDQFRGATDRELFTRQVRNLEVGYRSRGLGARAREVARVRMLLDSETGSRLRGEG
jgi:regulator of sirC expression with transglutaminase-like and TPR domain